MLLKLSRASFWLAASAAAAAPWLPMGQETRLTGVAMVASAAAFLLWRDGVKARTRAHSAASAPAQRIVRQPETRGERTPACHGMCAVNVAAVATDAVLAPCGTQFNPAPAGRPEVPEDARRFCGHRFDDTPATPSRQNRQPAMLNPCPSPSPHPHAASDSSGASAPGRAAPGSSTGEFAQPVLDAEALARLAALDPKGESRLIERVLKAFQTSAARLMPQLEAAQRGADRAAIRLVAHTLKSSSASIGALALSVLCARIENAIRLDPTAEIDADIVALREALDVALRAIERLLTERHR